MKRLLLKRAIPVDLKQLHHATIPGTRNDPSSTVLGNDEDLVNVDIELRLIMSTQEIDLI